MAKQALIDAINESIAPFVHPDDLKPSRLTLSLWSGRIRFPHGLRLNADAINKELVKSNPSASSDEGHGGGGIGDRIRRRGRGNSTAAEGNHPPYCSSHHTSSSVPAGDGPTSAAGPTPKAASSGGASGGMWSPFSFGTGWSRSEAATEQQSNSTREHSPAVRQQAKAARRMSDGTAGAFTLASDLAGGDGKLNMGGGRDKPVHNSGVSYTTPSSFIDEAWAVNVDLEPYRNAQTEEDHQKAREEAQTSDTSSRSTNPFLAGLGLPSNVRLISGYIRQVQIDIPWSSLATKPVVIKLSGVKLAVMPTSLSEQNDAGGFAAATPHSTSTGGGGGLFRARGKEAMMRKLRTKEEQTIVAKRRRILMEKEIRKRQQDAFLRCLFEDRTAISGRDDNETETSGRDSPAPSIASVGSRSTVTGSGSDVLRAAAHTSVASTVFGTSSEQRRMSFVLGGNEEDEEEDGYGMHSISTSSATSMYHRSSLNTSGSRSQSPFLKSPASESMRKMMKRQKMPNEVFRSRLRRKIIENLCLDVRGIHIQICRPNGAENEATEGARKKSNGFVLGIVLDSLQFYTTDEHGRKVRAQGRGGPVKRSTFLKPKTSGKGVDSTGGRPMGATFLFKALRVSGLGVYLEEGKSRVEIDEETLFGGATVSSRDNGPDQGDMYGAGSQDSAHRRPSDSGDDISLASMDTDGLNDEVLAGGYGRRYVVNPISFEAAFRQRNDELPTVLQSQSASAMTPVQRRQTEKGTGDDETDHLLFSQLPHLSIVLSEPQLRLASEVVDSFLPIGGKRNSGLSMVLRPLYPEYRPACSITSLTASDWWRYAIRSVRRIRRPGSCMWRNFMLAFRKKRQYVSLYKRYVAHCDPRDQAFYEMTTSSFSHRCTKYCCRAYECLAPADIEAMRAIEDDRFISIEALLGWRAEVLAQLWRERRLQMTKAGEVAQLGLGESMSRIQSVFQGGLGGLGGSACPSKGNEVEIQVDDMDTSGNQNAASLALTAEDLNRLELQLEAYVDSPSRTSSSRIAELELSLGFVVVDLVSSDLSPVAKLRLGTLDLSCVMLSNSQSVLSLTLSSVLLEDMTTFDPMIHTIMRSVHHAAPMDDNSAHSGVGTSGGSTTQPCPASKLSLKRTATGDLEVSLKMTTFEFLFSPSFSSSLNAFLDLNDNGDNLLDAPGLCRCAKKMFRAAIRKIKSRAKSLWDEKCRNGKRWDVDIALDPVVLIAPGNAMDADSRAVILSLGQHQLKTTPKEEEKPMGSFEQIWFDEQNRSSKASLDTSSTVAPTTRSGENETSIVTDRWELIVSGITAAIGPSNDENWRHYVVDELIHAGAHSDGNMIAADVRPYLVLRPCVFQVDLGSSTSMEKNIIKHRRSWVSVNAASPPLLVRLRSDDIVVLGRSARQMQEVLGKLTPRLPTAHGEPAVGNLYFQEDDNGRVGSDGILPASIVPDKEQLEQLHRQEEPTHAFHFSYGIPRLKLALKLSREGSFITQLDSMRFALSSNSDKMTSGRFELADAWVFYQVEESEPTVIFGDKPPSTKPATSNCPDEGKNLVSAELSIAEAGAGSNTPLNIPFGAMGLTFRVQTRDVVVNMHPKLLRLAIKSYRRIKQGLSFALAPTADEDNPSRISTGPGTSTFISFPQTAILVDDDDRSVGSNSSSDSSVSTAESLMEPRPTRDFLGHFFPALSNAKRDLFRPTSVLAVTASLLITSMSISIIPDNNEEPSHFDIVFSDNVFGINTDDDGGKTTSLEIGKVAITSASSYAYRQEYCKVLRGGEDKGAKFLVLDYTKSPSSTVDTETGKIKPQTQTHVRIAPIHCVYLQSQVTILSDFLHKSGLRAVLAPAVSFKKCLALIDSNEVSAATYIYL